MKWCKGKFYTVDRDKLPKAKSAKRRDRGTALLWSLRGENIAVENKNVGNNEMLAKERWLK